MKVLSRRLKIRNTLVRLPHSCVPFHWFISKLWPLNWHQMLPILTELEILGTLRGGRLPEVKKLAASEKNFQSRHKSVPRCAMFNVIISFSPVKTIFKISWSVLPICFRFCSNLCTRYCWQPRYILRALDEITNWLNLHN